MRSGNCTDEPRNPPVQEAASASTARRKRRRKNRIARRDYRTPQKAAPFRTISRLTRAMPASQSRQRGREV